MFGARGTVAGVTHTGDLCEHSVENEQGGEEGPVEGVLSEAVANGALPYPKAILPFFLQRIPILLKSQDVIL